MFDPAPHERTIPVSDRAGLIARLTRLYREQLEATPDDGYLAHHADPQVIETQIDVFRWYSRELQGHLQPGSTVLDWGCRHAPDSCLLRMANGHAYAQHAADIEGAGLYPVFHGFAGMQYAALGCVYRLPYPDGLFDAVIGSGTLEHVAMDFESLKELWRVLKVGGRLVIAYLPNRISVEEWWKRRIQKNGFHHRLYGKREFNDLLLHHGFRPLTIGYQTRFDLLGETSPLLKWPVKFTQAHRFTSTLCAVAEKVAAMM